ncbi:MAG: hypothetical protein OKBPIBMD_00326 [Chlorobi bacterium]|nr:hypothetical protein [Chlorobiota bacterium]
MTSNQYTGEHLGAALYDVPADGHYLVPNALMFSMHPVIFARQENTMLLCLFYPNPRVNNNHIGFTGHNGV